MKKIGSLLIVLMAACMISACGREAAPAVHESSGNEAGQQSGEAGTRETAEQTVVPDDTTASEESASAEETTASEETVGVYEDNFSVPAGDAAAFAAKIRVAVEAQDMESLAALAGYPLYIGLEQGGISVSSDEAFLKLGAKTIFTPELLTAVSEADETSLTPSKAGFVLAKDGRPNIVFGVRDGELAILGINY